MDLTQIIGFVAGFEGCDRRSLDPASQIETALQPRRRVEAQPARRGFSECRRGLRLR
jgi:hypothetical protein